LILETTAGKILHDGLLFQLSTADSAALRRTQRGLLSNCLKSTQGVEKLRLPSSRLAAICHLPFAVSSRWIAARGTAGARGNQGNGAGVYESG